MSKLFIKKVSFTLVFLAIMLLALGCSKEGQEIVGAWDNVKAPEIVEFKPDGTGAFKYPNNQNPPLAFSWQHAAKNSFVLEVNFNGTRKSLTATVNDKSLGIESTMGKEEYKKQISH